MAYDVKLPDIGEGVAEGEIVRWLVKAGDAVTEDQPLVEVMTDKASVEIPSPRTGTITTLLGVGSGIVLLASLAGLGVPALRRRVVPPFARGAQVVLDAVRSPRQIALLVGGSLFAYTCFGLALAATLHAFGQSPSLFEVIAANTGVTLIAALVPFPGGTTALASVGLSGALVAVGVPQTAAVGGVLLHQLLTQYIPAVPGWFALRSLVARDEL